MKTKAIREIALTLLLVSALTLIFDIAPVAAEATASESTYFVEGVGTYFEVTNSTYVNVTLTSTETVHVYLESVPRVVGLIIESNSSATSTVLTFAGFEPDTTYYRYQDGNLTESFTTDSAGSCSYVQDISSPHHIFIVENITTIYIQPDGTVYSDTGLPVPISISIVDGIYTYTFTGDITEPIIVQRDNIVIDGDGYTLQGPGSGYGFHLQGVSGVTIKNAIIKGWSYGIYLVWYTTTLNTISGNTVSDNSGSGIMLWYSGGNTISGNTVSNNGNGISLSTQSSGNTVSGNTVSNNGNGITIYNMCQLNTLSGNTVSFNNVYGIYMWTLLPMGDNLIYHNNIIANVHQAYDSCGWPFGYERPLNDWHHPDLLEGNYWSDYTGEDVGGQTYAWDTAGKHLIADDGIGDTLVPHPAEYYDYYPFVSESGWIPPGDTPPGTDVEVTDPVTGTNIAFGEVTSSGTTTVTTSTTGPPPPEGFRIVGTAGQPVYYDITTTATYSGTITVAIRYDETQVAREDNLRLWQSNNGWNDITWYVDTTNNIIYGNTTHLSIFAVMEIENLPPVADANGPYIGYEGSPITFDAGGSNDPDGDPLQYRWDFNNDGTWDTEWSTDPTASHTWTDDWIGTAKLEVSDDELTDTDTTSVTVNNVAPTVGEIDAPVDPVKVDTLITASAPFTDLGVLDTHTATWDWGDGSTSPGTVDETAGSSTVSGSHVYATPGVYTVKLTITDDDGGEGSAQFEYVVVYDPEGGFVTGGGWINSPEGAYTPDPSLTGKANFGFVSKYKKGATTPSGQTQFVFRVADLNFHSTSYQWLVVAGSKAQFKGSGTINGEGDYGFMLTAVDGQLDGTGVDKFRIKIWDKATDTVIYDNQMGDADDTDATTAIEGGSIVIHK